MRGVYCISGIDTDIGKTVATGILARWLLEQNVRVITLKMVQTGCPDGVADDILIHRKMMGTGLFPEDREGMTAPYVFSLPASPELAAREEGKSINPERIRAAVDTLIKRYDVVLVEGAGGLAVPLTPERTLLDCLEIWGFPVILVTGPRLGSINHTLLSLEVLHTRKIPVRGLLYNLHFPAERAIIQDSRTVFLRALKKSGYPTVLIDIPEELPEGNKPTLPDYSPLFQAPSD